MTALINFVFFILGGLLSLLWWAIVISAILSWLVAFDVINRRNNAVYQILDFLDRVTGPVLRPFQRIIPSLGGVDISPIIVLLIISGVQNYLLPALRMTLVGLVGGLIMALVTIFKKTWSPVTAPLYAGLEGLFLGGISAFFEARHPGIVMQAVTLTFGTLGALLHEAWHLTTHLDTRLWSTLRDLQNASC